MSRVASVFLALGLLACTKAPANQEAATKPNSNGDTGGPGAKIAVPGGETAGTVKGGGESAGGNDARFKLQPEEGKLDIQAPGDAKANAETTAKVIVTAGKEFKVNTEFPTKLTLDNAEGVTI